MSRKVGPLSGLAVRKISSLPTASPSISTFRSGPGEAGDHQIGRGRVGVAELAHANIARQLQRLGRLVGGEIGDLHEVGGAHALGGEHREQVVVGLLDLPGKVGRQRAVRLDADLAGHHQPFQPVPERVHGRMMIAPERRMHGRRIVTADERTWWFLVCPWVQQRSVLRPRCHARSPIMAACPSQVPVHGNIRCCRGHGACAD